MGGPMARHLVHAGHEVSAFNRSIDKASAWAKLAGGAVANTVQAAAEGAEVFILCVGNDDDVRQVVSQALTHLQPGAVIIDHTTTSAVVAREMSDAASSSGRHFIDAPVSGGQAGAENGQLSVMAGGDTEALARVEPILKTYSKAIKRMGPPGSGQLAKMVNQIAIAGLVQSLSEAIAFAENAGLDVAAVIDTISKGAAQSWQMVNRWETMHDRRFDFGFAVDWMRKDLGICLAEAQRNGSSLPIATSVNERYGEVQKNGGGRWDTSSLITLLPSNSKSEDGAN